MSDISRNIKLRRTAQCLSQEQLAEKLGVTRQTVSNWERGAAQPDLETLERIAVALDCEPAALMHDSGAGSPSPIAVRVRFVFWSMLGYMFVFVLGYNILAAIFQPSVKGSYQLAVGWAIVLLVGYIAVCVCLVTFKLSEVMNEWNK